MQCPIPRLPEQSLVAASTVSDRDALPPGWSESEPPTTLDRLLHAGRVRRRPWAHLKKLIPAWRLHPAAMSSSVEPGLQSLGRPG